MQKLKQNLIKKVVFRVDFIEDQFLFNDDVPAELNSEILKKLLRKEVRIYKEERIIEASVNSTKSITVEGKEFNYFDKDKEKKIAISKSYFLSEFTKYTTFNEFMSYVAPIINYLKSVQHDFRIRRVGLRYVDEINLKEKNLFNWNKYLNKKLIANLNFLGNSIQYTRTFNILEFYYGENKVIYQFGMFNPDYPNPINKKIFVFDTDTFKNGDFYIDDIEAMSKDLHKIQKKIFEISITEGMVNYLNARRK